MKNRLRLYSVLLFLLGLISQMGQPARVDASSPSRTIDDASLLLISSYARMDSDDTLVMIRANGSMFRFPAAEGQTLNEIESLIRIRQDLHARQLAKADELYGETQAASIKASLEEEQQLKIEPLLQAAERLKKSRARRRRRGLFGFFRRVGRGIANVLTRTLNIFGKVTRFVVTEFGPQVVKNMIMKKVAALNALIQGRFDLVWERVRGRLGGPITDLIRAVVDEAFVRERDRLMIRIGMRTEASGQADAGSASGSGSQGGGPARVCDDLAWVDPYFEGVQGELIAERRSCQVRAANEYRNCLMEKAGEGQCKEQAIASCASAYDAIPANLPGGSSGLVWQKIHGGALNQEAQLDIPAGGGPVSGRIYYELYDSVMICTITSTTILVGTYEPETCTLSGAAEISLYYDGMNCVSVCGTAPSSPTSCPVTKTGSTTWEAKLEDGALSGEVGDDSCEPHCYMFYASP